MIYRMSKAFHRDDQDWKSQTSDYSAPKKKREKATPLQKAQAAEIASGATLDRYLNEDDDDLTNEWDVFLWDSL